MDNFASFISSIELIPEVTKRDKIIEEESRRPNIPQEERTKPLEYIKVALIDDGVDGFDSTISKSIANGVSYCHDSLDDSSDLVKSYYVSQGGHGTMMARLILRMCPKAKLYVARLQEYTSGRRRFIQPESATQVCGCN
jgi:hypothetical protein